MDVMWRTDTGQLSSTLCALSSVARLSVSMTMLMSSGAHRRRLYLDGMIGSGASASQASCSKQPASAGDETTPSPAQLNKATHHRHLWKKNPKRSTSSAGGRGVVQRGARIPARIESLPNMLNETLTTSPHSAASARRKVYGSAGRRRPQASSLSGIRGHRSRTGASPSASIEAITTEESSTSCGEDSSDGPVFDIIREESIKRPSGLSAVQQTADTDATTISTPAAMRSSPVNNSGVSIVIDNNDISTGTGTETAVLPTESSTLSLNTTSSDKQQQQQLDERTSVCQQSGSKTFLLSEMT